MLGERRESRESVADVGSVRRHHRITRKVLADLETAGIGIASTTMEVTLMNLS